MANGSELNDSVVIAGASLNKGEGVVVYPYLCLVMEQGTFGMTFPRFVGALLKIYREVPLIDCDVVVVFGSNEYNLVGLVRSAVKNGYVSGVGEGGKVQLGCEDRGGPSGLVCDGHHWEGPASDGKAGVVFKVSVLPGYECANGAEVGHDTRVSRFS